MNIQLPSSIATFFKVSNGADASALGDCFASDAIVHDEDHTYQGLEAIQAWRRAAKRKYTYTVEPLESAQEGASVQVRAQVTGNFPGSPAQLEYLFQLADAKIEALEIRG